MKMLKKGQAGNIQGFIMAIVGVAVVLAVGLIVLSKLQTTALDSTGATTKASNATGEIITALSDVPDWISILIVVVLAVIVLGYFYMRGQ